MAWTVTCAEQEGKEYVGTATAVWNAGEPDEFRFMAVGDRNQIEQFATAARAAKTAHDAARAREIEVAAEIAALLNAE